MDYNRIDLYYGRFNSCFHFANRIGERRNKIFGLSRIFWKRIGCFKILGVLALVIPQVLKRIKEWAYAGFTFDFFLQVLVILLLTE
ncbi:MAG: DoxX family protein [Chitinophagaceae bacterium]